MPTAGEAALDRTVMIILNGGLGTSMGLTGPKSLLTVKGRQDLSGNHPDPGGPIQGPPGPDEQLHHTEAATAAAVAAADSGMVPLTFLQHKFPKILQEDFTPATWPANPELEWNPPGHGDVYTALQTSGMLDRLLAEGVDYAFISNSDNLGAVPGHRSFGLFCRQRHPVYDGSLRENRRRTSKAAIWPGIANGRLILREAAQCPRRERARF